MTAIDRTAYPPSVASVRDGLVTTFYTYLQLTPRPAAPLGSGLFVKVGVTAFARDDTTGGTQTRTANHGKADNVEAAK